MDYYFDYEDSCGQTEQHVTLYKNNKICLLEVFIICEAIEPTLF